MPLLCNIISELVRGSLSIEAACATARDAIAGSPENVAGIRTRMLRPIGEIHLDIAIWLPTSLSCPPQLPRSGRPRF
jgi:hypothetical protein